MRVSSTGCSLVSEDMRCGCRGWGQGRPFSGDDIGAEVEKGSVGVTWVSGGRAFGGK